MSKTISAYRTYRSDEEEEQEDGGERRETVASDALIPYKTYLMPEHWDPRRSSFIPSFRKMYYIVHCLDKCVPYEFKRDTRNWHPYISRLYFGIIGVIQVLRCMSKANALHYKDSLFLTNFLDQFPLDSLYIPGPLMPFYQSICCSNTQYPQLGMVYPRLPDRSELHPRSDEGEPRPVPSSWLIPNIPELIGLTNLLLSKQSNQSNSAADHEMKSDDNGPIVNGYRWSWVSESEEGPKQTQEAMTATPNIRTYNISGATWPVHKTNIKIHPDTLKWYFTTPGLEYQPECDHEMERAFIHNGERYCLPVFERSSKFDTLESYLGLADHFWFEQISILMRSYSLCFKASATLAECPVVGPPAAQVVCKYVKPTIELKAPNFPGDRRWDTGFSFKPMSQNTTLTESEQHHGFYSQLNINAWPDHPFLGQLQHREGPFWDACKFVIEGVDNASWLSEGANIVHHFIRIQP